MENVNINNSDKIIEERKEQLFEFLKKKANWIYYLILAGIVYLSIFIRTRNMKINPATGKPGLWDITTNNWTLGPDLDPFLFLRWGKYIFENGKMMAMDMMRYPPLGYDTSGELPLIPYSIAYFNKLLIILGLDKGIEYSAVLLPVVLFAFTVIAFFFLVRTIFWKEFKNKNIVNIIALIASFLLTASPVILPRTIAGIPEKESAAFLFLFLAFLFFILAWNEKNRIKIAIFVAISSISTMLMAATWGGYGYIFLVISVSVLISFLIGQVNIRKFYTYSSWMILSFLLMIPVSNRYNPKSLMTSTLTGLAIVVFLIILIHIIIKKTKIRDYLKKYEKKIPLQLISLIISIFIILIGAIIFFGLDFLTGTFNSLFSTLVKPDVGRLIQTVAENRQPYFGEWAGNFGPNIQKIPLLFSLFFIGSIFLFYRLIKRLKTKDRIYLTIFYIIFLIAIIFSRYSSQSVLNGLNNTSLFFYFGGIALFIIFSLKTYFKLYHNKEMEKLRMINFGPILIMTFFVLGIISARGAVRLIMMLVPSISAITGYLAGYSIEKVSKIKDCKDDVIKIIGCLFAIILIISVFYSGLYFYKFSKSQSEMFIPSQYQWQWQKAMSWVRDNTSENAIFGHWWDYGYWLQGIGKRTTVLDGGNAIPYWNHMMGRYVLTSPDDKVALEFLYAHNTDYYLIDSTEIGKYGAYSSIGSNINYDRAGYIANFALDEKQIVETKNSTIAYYSTEIPLDEDIRWEENGEIYNFAKQNSGIGMIIVEKMANEELKQPKIIVASSNGVQKEIPIRYMYYKGNLYDFKSGLESGIVLMDHFIQDSQGLRAIKRGAGFYLSSRTVNSFLARKYFYGEEGDFKLVYTENNYIIDMLKQQGFDAGDFAYFQGQFLGPIKIWEIEYPDDIEIKQEYLETTYPEELL